MTSLRIYLVRHGETAWSLSGQHTGRTDIALTARGEEQARGLARPLATVKFSAVYTSPLQRARQTCALAGFGPVAKVDPRVAEWHYGSYESKTTAEIHATRPGWKVFEHGAPGGESPEQVTARVDSMIADLKGAEGNVLVFSHGHCLRTLGARWIGLPVTYAGRLMLGVAALSVVTCHQGNVEVPVIESWNGAASALLA
ncbi:histidine phosphatase family protein [Candidatus Sumerlaeota bacterium]|nr:histidine phosphatase family protein [Candidatus Sumerlaeota bacterium]